MYILSVFFVGFVFALVGFTHNSKEPSSRRKISIMPGRLQENLALSAASQSEGAYYCSRIINDTKQTFKALHFSSYLLSSSLIVFSCLATSRVHSSVRIMSKQRHVSAFLYPPELRSPTLPPTIFSSSEEKEIKFTH